MYMYVAPDWCLNVYMVPMAQKTTRRSLAAFREREREREGSLFLFWSFFTFFPYITCENHGDHNQIYTLILLKTNESLEFWKWYDI